jgi:dienelactone hydrolase
MAEERFPSGGSNVAVSVVEPTGTEPHAAVVLVYGTRGLNEPFGTAIRHFAGELAAADFVALVPDYLSRTGTLAARDQFGDGIVLEDFMRHRDAWIATLGDCVSYAHSRTATPPAGVGVVGFSMGGHLALRLAKAGRPEKIGAVVDFFAPIARPPFFGLGNRIADLPPVQVHYGEADGLVPPTESRPVLKDLLDKAGKVEGTDYELHFYPGQGHGFQGADVHISSQRTVAFLERHLGVA